ncbi:Insect cuticle protein [Trinorchestia longiramus]|nr:Insect cuticle protein [Trinorchestia longiramus]
MLVRASTAEGMQLTLKSTVNRPAQNSFYSSDFTANVHNPRIQNRVHRSPDDVEIFSHRNPNAVPSLLQEFVTTVETEPEFGRQIVRIEDDDDFDDSNERKALFIRRIDGFQDRTHERRKQRQQFSHRPLRKLLNLRNFLRGGGRQNSTSIFSNLLRPKMNDGTNTRPKFKITKSGDIQTMQGLEISSTSEQKLPVSLVHLSSIEDDEFLLDDGQGGLTVHSLEDFGSSIGNHAHDTVFGLEIPNKNNSFQQILITGENDSKLFSLSDHEQGLHFSDVESSEVVDLDDLFEDDLSVEIPLIVPSTILPEVPPIVQVEHAVSPGLGLPLAVQAPVISAKPQSHVKIVISAETNATHASLSIPKAVMQQHPQQVQDFIHRFRKKMKKPLETPRTDAMQRDQPTSHVTQYQKHGPHNDHFEKNDNKLRSSLKSNAGQFLERYGQRYSSGRRRFPKMNVAKEMKRRPSLHQDPDDDDVYHSSYEFSYEISEDDVQLGHEETRSGSRVEGEFHVLLPSGQRQIVSYYADETGYHPTIRYESPIEISPRKILKKTQEINVISTPTSFTSNTSLTTSPSTMIDVSGSPPNEAPKMNGTNISFHGISFSDENPAVSASFLKVGNASLDSDVKNKALGHFSLKESEVLSSDDGLNKNIVQKKDPISYRSSRQMKRSFPGVTRGEKDEGTPEFMDALAPMELPERFSESSVNEDKLPTIKTLLFSKLGECRRTGKQNTTSSKPRTGFFDFAPSRPLRLPNRSESDNPNYQLQQEFTHGLSNDNNTNTHLKALGSSVEIPVPEVPWRSTSSSKIKHMNNGKIIGELKQIPHDKHQQIILQDSFQKRSTPFEEQNKHLSSKIRSDHPSVKAAWLKPVPKDFKRSSRSLHENGPLIRYDSSHGSRSRQPRGKKLLSLDDSCFLRNKCFIADVTRSSSFEPTLVHRIPYLQHYIMGT